MSDIKLDTNELKASYGIGLNLGQQLQQNPFEGMDVNAVTTGILDVFSNNVAKVSDQELEAAFKHIHELMQKEKEEQSKNASAEGEAFLAENSKREEVTVLDSGLQYEVITSGNGDKPIASSKVRTHYHGTFTNGKVFDSSYERGQPAEFPVGGVIKGWTEALQIMPVGSKWKLYIPYHLAYGERGSPGGIPPYATLIFDIELLDIID